MVGRTHSTESKTIISASKVITTCVYDFNGSLVNTFTPVKKKKQGPRRGHPGVFIYLLIKREPSSGDPPPTRLYFILPLGETPQSLFYFIYNKIKLPGGRPFPPPGRVTPGEY